MIHSYTRLLLPPVEVMYERWWPDGDPLVAD